jgi:hypothetical protein
MRNNIIHKTHPYCYEAYVMYMAIHSMKWSHVGWRVIREIEYYAMDYCGLKESYRRLVTPMQDSRTFKKLQHILKKYLAKRMFKGKR